METFPQIANHIDFIPDMGPWKDRLLDDQFCLKEVTTGPGFFSMTMEMAMPWIEVPEQEHTTRIGYWDGDDYILLFQPE
jgi:hypothetical protein